MLQEKEDFLPSFLDFGHIFSLEAIASSVVRLFLCINQELNALKVGTYVVVDMFGLPADTIKDEFRTKVCFIECVILYLRMKSLGGSSKRLESKLRRGPVYFSKGKEVERRTLKMNSVSFSLDVSNIFDSTRSYNIQVVLPELAVLRLQIH